GRRDFDGALNSINRALRLADEQGNVHTQVNGTVLTARVYLCCGSPERAVELFEKRVSRFTSPGMEGEYLAAHAMALACTRRTDEARSLLEQSERVSSQLDSAALRDVTRLIAAYFELGKIDPELQVRALTTIDATGN